MRCKENENEARRANSGKLRSESPKVRSGVAARSLRRDEPEEKF